jgi:hypothetical protein
MVRNKIGRIAALVGALATAGAMSVAVTPASATIACKGPCLPVTPTFTNWPVSGSLTAKTFSQKVSLPQGSVFNGHAEIILERPAEVTIGNGVITGTVTVPPFTAPVTIPINEIPTPVSMGITFTQVGLAEGVLTEATGCTRGPFACMTVSVPTRVNVGFTVVGVLGIMVPTHCETSKPIKFDLKGGPLTLLELLNGLQFTGKTTIPPIKCEGLEGLLLAPAMTAALSGPENPYEIGISPPPE